MSNSINLIYITKQAFKKYAILNHSYVKLIQNKKLKSIHIELAVCQNDAHTEHLALQISFPHLK